MSTIEEAMTGCYARGKNLELYDCDGTRLSTRKARQHFRNGAWIHVPSAGAGSYKDVFKSMGVQEFESFEWSSSAGHWTFMVRMKIDHVLQWVLAFQENRYPYYGFKYAVSKDMIADTKQQLLELIT